MFASTVPSAASDWPDAATTASPAVSGRKLFAIRISLFFMLNFVGNCAVAPESVDGCCSVFGECPEDGRSCDTAGAVQRTPPGQVAQAAGLGLLDVAAEGARRKYIGIWGVEESGTVGSLPRSLRRNRNLGLNT
ncbi:conserved hypothetical protein [Ricinus communis]|uniref:Uncharacterized protein n=1 Tax=Ricinus communis TaxID=3988 RepID=B9TD47_RICCO|nr:conserved hypothetical protein [Ricinus communis]